MKQRRHRGTLTTYQCARACACVSEQLASPSSERAYSRQSERAQGRRARHDRERSGDCHSHAAGPRAKKELGARMPIREGMKGLQRGLGAGEEKDAAAPTLGGAPEPHGGRR